MQFPLKLEMETLLMYTYFFVEINDFTPEIWSLDKVFLSMASICDPIRNFDKRNPSWTYLRQK